MAWPTRRAHVAPASREGAPMSARDPRADPPTQIIRHELSVRSILTILPIGLACWLLVQVWPIMLLLIIALILAGTLSPMVVWLEHRRVKRGLALAIILLGLVMAIAGLGALVVPTLVSQISNLVASAPTFQHRLA